VASATIGTLKEGDKTGAAIKVVKLLAQSTGDFTREELKKDVKLSWTDKTKAEIAAAKGEGGAAANTSGGGGTSTGGNTQQGGSTGGNTGNGGNTGGSSTTGGGSSDTSDPDPDGGSNSDE